MLRGEALIAGHVEEDPPPYQWRHGFDAEDAEADRGLDPFVDVHPAVQHEVLSLVGKRVDVRARVLRHHDDAGRAGAGLRCTTRVVAMQEVVEARRVRRMRGCACVAELLEVEDAGRAERAGEARGHLLAVAVDDAPAGQVVGRELHPNAVAWRDANEVAPHAAGCVGDELVPVLELDLEHRIRQRLRDDCVHDYSCFFLVTIVAIRFSDLWRSRTSTRTFRFPQDS